IPDPPAQLNRCSCRSSLDEKKRGRSWRAPSPHKCPCDEKKRGQRESIMPATERQALHALPQMKRMWLAAAVKDPRGSRNQKHSHQGLLSVLTAAFACGRTCLRRVEDFAADLSAPVRKKLGLQPGLSDT